MTRDGFSAQDEPRMRVMVSCGEASGDLYAGALVRALRARDSRTEVFGLASDRFAAAGGELIGDFHALSVTGLVEVLRILPQSWAMYRRLVEIARARRPDVLVLIDYPDFNFRLMAAVRRLGIPIVYYVSPQLWAWRPGRIHTMKALVDLVLPIFPFEEELYRREGIPVRFVGHPLIDLAVANESRDVFLRGLDLDPHRPTIALLPGSRRNELHRLVPVLATAVPRLSQGGQRQFVVARAPNLPDSFFVPFRGSGVAIRIVEGRTDDVLAASDVVVTASGTATVQTALHGKPMVVVYRLSPLTYRLGKPLVKVKMYSMVNLVAGERVVPELIQEDCTAETVTREVTSLLTDEERASRMRDALATVRARLGAPGASERAADAIIDLIRQKRVAR
jgi:lipid-A-disaccharide synthase